jgi:hypothetical protein
MAITWAAGDDAPPLHQEILPNGDLLQIEFRYNSKKLRERVCRKVKTVPLKVTLPKAVLRRSTLTKFGDVLEQGNDDAPNLGEEVFLTLAQEEKVEKVELLQQKILCRICKGDHWTIKCPYKDTYLPVNEIQAQSEKEKEKQRKPKITIRRGRQACKIRTVTYENWSKTNRCISIRTWLKRQTRRPKYNPYLKSFRRHN